MKKDTDDTVIQLTPFGLISQYTTDDDMAREITDAIELFMRRTGQAMAVVENKLSWVQVDEN